jgi:putative endonuclease
MQNNSQKAGKDGEALARKHLLRLGYKILESNWRFKKLEVDLIAEIADTIVFVEVKTRKSNIFGEPEVFVTRKKQNFLIAAAHQYLTENNISLESRFDIISVLLHQDDQIVKHLEGAFYPTVK